MSFADKTLVCRDCKQNFTFTAGEQEFYANKGLQNEPVRCPSCRSVRKSTRTPEPEEGYVRYGVFASFGGRTGMTRVCVENLLAALRGEAPPNRVNP